MTCPSHLQSVLNVLIILRHPYTRWLKVTLVTSKILHGQDNQEKYFAYAESLNRKKS